MGFWDCTYWPRFLFKCKSCCDHQYQLINSAFSHRWVKLCPLEEKNVAKSTETTVSPVHSFQFGTLSTFKLRSLGERLHRQNPHVDASSQQLSGGGALRAPLNWRHRGIWMKIEVRAAIFGGWLMVLPNGEVERSG